MADLALPGGIPADGLTDLDALIADIGGTPLRQHAWLAPVLLLQEPAVRRAIGLDETSLGRVIVQDSLRLDLSAELKPDSALTGALQRDGDATVFAIRRDRSDIAQLRLGLRRVTSEELAAAQPAPLRAGMLDAAIASRDWTIGRESLVEYLRLSGDTNPIHRTPPPGLGAPVVPGMLVAAMVQPLAEHLGALRSLSTRFIAPLAEGETVTTSLLPRPDEADGTHRARCMVHAGNGILAIADLRLTP